MEKSIALFVVSIKHSKILKISYIFEKTLVLLLFILRVTMKMKKYMKKKNQKIY